MVTGDVFHHLLQVFYPDWNFPKNSNVDEAKASRRRVLEEWRIERRAGLSGARRRPVCRLYRKSGSFFRPRF